MISTAPLRYVQIMAAGKPYLLTEVKNNLGWVTSLSYTPSTAYYAVFTYDDDGSEAPAGEMGGRALVWQSYRLALTASQAATLDDRLGALGLTRTLLDEGYVDLSALLADDTDGAWVRSGTQTRDADHFYVTNTFTDPWGNDTDIGWHASFLFPTSVTDALGNLVSATYDLRVLAPKRVTDPNGTKTHAAYDPFGRIVRMARESSTGDDGDTLANPTQTMTYTLDAVPACVLVRARDKHASVGGTPHWIETTTYSDGAGNAVQVKTTAADSRWVGSGRVILNNKGMPIKQYEPFFATTDTFEPEKRFSGVTPVIHHDPIGRAYRVDLPNGTLRRITLDPWQQTTWDENDTIGESTASAALVAAVGATHPNTPTTVDLDVQGRPFRTHERLTSAGTPLRTTLTLDILGNPRVVTDARNIDIQTQTFDLLGRPVDTDSPDGGHLDVILDPAGQPRFTFKSGNLGIEREFDALRRPVRTWEWTTSGTPGKKLRERLVYGEAAGGDNRKGRIARSYETAGAVEYAYDWEGNPTGETWRFLDDVDTDVDWDDGLAYPLAADDDGDVVDALEAVGIVEATTYATARGFDALGRMFAEETPDASVTHLGYDAGGRLVTVAANLRGSGTPTPFVTGITYNARGQRETIAYGNTTSTVYTYEPTTFRLLRVKTGATQDLNYTYDAVGNIVAIQDLAQDTQFFDNQAVDATRTFLYDALYRLTSGTGREKNPNPVPSWQDPTYGPLPAADAIDRYLQSFTYDDAGNLLTMVHDGIADWTREFSIASDSNRLDAADYTDGTGTHAETFDHDDRGNMTTMPHLPGIAVDFRDLVRTITLGSGTMRMFYDRGGKRVRKVKIGDEDRRYVGRWETWSNGSETIESLHLMDDQSRICIAEFKTSMVLRYQLADHLGTAQWELDGAGNVLTYEEFHPYGSTAWWEQSTTVSLKRYRYTGMERDEETGLQCHGVRYYATWLGRWTSADPIGLGDGVNRYRYCHDRPTGGYDPGGTADFGWYDRISTAAHAAYDAAAGKVKGAGDALAAVGTAVAHPIDTAVAVYDASPHKKVIEGHFAEAAEQAVAANVAIGKGALATAKTVVGTSTGVLPATNLYLMATGTRDEVKVAAEAGVDQTVTTAGVVAPIVAPEAIAAGVARIAPALRGASIVPKLSAAAPAIEEVTAASRGTGAFLEGTGGGEGLGWLSGKSVTVSPKGLSLVEGHLAQFGDVPANTAMLGRLRGALESGTRITGQTRASTCTRPRRRR